MACTPANAAMADAAAVTQDDALLRRPTRVPTNTVLRMTDDPTFAAWEPYGAPELPAPTFPFDFQCTSLRVVEDPTDRASDVAAFRKGKLDEAHYAECAASTARPKNGKMWGKDIKESGAKKSARTFVRMVGTASTGHLVTVFKPYHPPLYVRTEADNAGLNDSLFKLLEGVDEALKLPGGSVTMSTERKLPLCGWQPEPDTWVRVNLPNSASRRHLRSILEKMGLQVAMVSRPINEELLVTMADNVRVCAHMRVLGGTLAVLDAQVEAVDVEVHDADCVCLHDDDDGAPPPLMPRKVLVADFEEADRARRGKMVKFDHEENRMSMVGILIRQLGTPALPKAKPRPAAAAAGSGEVETKAAAAAAAPAAAAEGFDFDAVDDIVHAGRRAAERVAGGGHDYDIARIIVSLYPLPPSPAYTVVLVNTEVQMFQAIRRLGVRFRVSVRTTHNGDGYDWLALRMRLMLLTHRDAVTCWFHDHDEAGGEDHMALRAIVDGRRRATFAEELQREAEERAAKRGTQPKDELSKEPIGLWAPLPPLPLERVRVALFNMTLLLAQLGLLQKAGWWELQSYADVLRPCLRREAYLAATPGGVLAAAPRGVTPAIMLKAVQACVEALRGEFVDAATEVRLIDYMAVRWASRYTGLEALPAALDAEFLETDVSEACAFTYVLTHTDQRGDRERGNYVIPSCHEVDTRIVSQSKWPKKSAKLNELARRLKIPTKRDMPYERMFDITDRIRLAQARQQRTARVGAKGLLTARGTPPDAGTLAAWEEVALYCCFDVIVTAEAMHSMGVVAESLMNGWLTRVHPGDFLRRGTTWPVFTTLVCRGFATHMTVIRPDGMSGGSYQGAFCLEPRRGFYEYEITSSVDVNSLYPTIIQQDNLCPSTLILDARHLAAARAAGLELKAYTFRGKPYHVVQHVKGSATQREGVLPRMMNFFITTRKATKRALKACRDPVQREQLDKKQLALKLLANGSYGAMAADAFKVPTKSLAAATTEGGRDVVMEMKRSINEDFRMPVLRAIREQICAAARVPPRFWKLEDARTREPCDLGGDTDSVFWRTPVVDGSPDTLVALELVDRLDAATGKYVAEPAREMTAAAAEVARATARYHARRAKTQLQRQLANDARSKQIKAAQQARVPVIRRVVVESERTLATRVAMALAEHVTQHMVSHCFNKREAKVGRRVMGIGVDYVMRRLLLLKKKNYAGLIWEAQMEDDDFEAKQKGMPSIKADTPKVVATMFGAIVKTLQLQGLEAACKVLRDGCEAILNDVVPVAQYAHLVQLSDPRNCKGDPWSLPQMSLLLRMRKRDERGELGTVEVPDIGTQMPMVKTFSESLKSTHTWECPAYIEQQQGRLRVDRVYYMEVMMKKMEYLGMESLKVLEETAVGYLMQMQAQRASGGKQLHGVVMKPVTVERVRQYRAHGALKRTSIGKVSVADTARGHAVKRPLTALGVTASSISSPHKSALNVAKAARRKTKKRMKSCGTLRL